MASRTITVDRRYLILPIDWGPTSGHLNIQSEANTVREFDLRLADAPGDFQAFLDLEPFLGTQLTIEHEGPSTASLDGIRLSDEPVEPSGLYRERLRPQFHFSSRRGWNNDPNGLVHYGGRYHMFYQHNPVGTDWGNMHWGHAVSSDLVHWTELPITLYPDELGSMYSGSAVVDWHDSAGLQQGDEPAIVAIYTAAGSHSPMNEGKPFSQCLAFSTDGGHSWTKYDGNPVLDHVVASNRDPKVFWHPETERWIMPLYMEKNDYAIFGSPNLLEWEHMSDLKLPGATECPELFSLPVDGDEGERRWVFWGANTTYEVGSFDGRTFRPEQATRKLQPDGCDYAAQTWSDLPAEDGRTVQIGWMRQTMPGMPFGQSMTSPRSLGLTRRDDGIALTAAPIRELESLREEEWLGEDIELTAGPGVEAGLGGELLDIELDIDLGGADSAGVVVRGVSIWYDRHLETLFCGSYVAPLSRSLTSLQLRILVDRASIEVFADGGATMVAAGIVLHPDDQAVRLFASGGSALARSVRVSRLRSAWPAAS
jgi:sucrose-6-phosphate hydrolase SacC (GH32 family)